MKKIFLPIVLCVLMVFSSLLLACTPIGEHDHNLVPVDEVAATCGKDGIRAHNVCTICGYWFDDDGNQIDELDCVIEATGKHTFKDGTCTVCGATDPTWQGGGGGEDPDNPDNPDNPDEPVDKLAWLQGEWQEEVETQAVKPWTVNFDGKELKISFYRDDELQVVTATSFKAEGDDKVTFVVPNGTQGEFSIEKVTDRRIKLNYGSGTTKALVKQGEPENPDTEYAIGMREVVKAGFALDKYESAKKNGMYFDFINGKQVDIKYSYLDYTYSDDGQLVKIEGVHNIKEAELLSTGTAYIWIEGIPGSGNRNRISWSGPTISYSTADWLGTGGKSDIAWINYNGSFSINDSQGTSFILGSEDFVFPEATKNIEGIWDFAGDIGGDWVQTEITVDVENNIVTYTETTTYGTASQGTKTQNLVGYFDVAVERKDNSGNTFFMMEARFPSIQGKRWFRYNPYNGKLIEKQSSLYKVYDQPDPNRPIPFAGALPADLKGAYALASDGTYTFSGKNVVFTPASGDAVSYVVTKLEDGTSDTTRKITLAVADDKKTTIVLTYDLIANTLTNGEKVYKGEELFVTPAENVPETLVGTYEYVGDNSNLSYVFDNDENYKVIRTEVSGQYIYFYVTAYDATTKTLTLTQVYDLETGHIINSNGATPEIVKMIYDETEKTVTVKGESADLDKVFKESAANLAAKVPEDISGTYYIEGKAKYIDIIGYDVILSGFDTAAKLNGEYGIYAFDVESGEMTLKAKDASATEEYVTLTLTDKKLSYNSETFTKGRPVKFTGEFYSLDAKYTITDNEITEEKVDGATTVYTIKSEEEEINSKKYGWGVKVKAEIGDSLNLWYDYVEDCCKISPYSNGNDTLIRLPATSTAGIPTEVANSVSGTYLHMIGYSDGTYRTDKIVVDFENGTFIIYGRDQFNNTTIKRYYISDYNDRDKLLKVKFIKELSYGFDATNPDEFKDGSTVYTRKIDKSKLPEKLQTDNSFFNMDETIDFNMTDMVVKITEARSNEVTGSGSPKAPTINVFLFAKYNDGVITLKSLLWTGTVREFYYDADKDMLKLKSSDTDYYASRPCETEGDVTALRGTFKNDTATLILDGTAKPILKVGNVYKQYLIKSFDKEAGKIVMFGGGSVGEVEFTYDAKTSTLTAGDDVYTIDNLPAGLDGTYKAAGTTYEFVIYMSGLVFSGGSKYQNGSFTISYDMNGRETVYNRLYCKGDKSSLDSFYLAIGTNGKLIGTNGGVTGTFTREQTTEPEKFDIPEYFFGKYYNDKSYVEIRSDYTVTVQKSTDVPTNGEYKITGWDELATITITQDSTGEVRYFTSMKLEDNGDCSLTYDYGTYIKHPIPVACDNLPDSVSGKYVRYDGNAYYVFDGTDVTYHFAQSVSDIKYVVVKYDEETKTITIASANNANVTKILDYDPDNDTITVHEGTAGTLLDLYTKEKA